MQVSTAPITSITASDVRWLLAASARGGLLSGERIVSLYATSRSEEEIASGFDAIAEELAAARGRYEQVKRLDAKLFGKDYGA